MDEARKLTPTPGQRGRIHAHAPNVTVKVSREIIDAAVTRDSGHCAIAEALQQVIPHAKYISVDLQTIRYSDPQKGLRYTYLTPRRAQVHLVEFDQGGAAAIEPFTILLRGGAVTAAGRRSGTVKALRMPGKKRELAGVNAAVDEEGKHSGPASVPFVSGGRTPPRGALADPPIAGKRREFGLRALTR